MASADAETHVRLLAERELRHAAASPRGQQPGGALREGGEPPLDAGLLRVRAVLSALGEVGALGQPAAGRLAAEFTGALAARGLHHPRALLGAVPDTSSSPPAAPAGAGPGAALPAGRYQAFPIGVVLPADREGHQGEVHVQALVLAPDRAAIVTSFASTWRETVLPAGGAGAPQPSFPPFGGSGVTDDQGRSYALTLQAAEAGWYETCVLSLSGVPPPDARWLDMAVGPGRRIRIDLTRPAATPDRRDVRSPPPAGELLLGAVAETLLGGGQMAGISATLLAGSLAEVTDALTTVGVLPPGSPAAARLAALCQHRAIEVRAPWADRARATGIPGPWASVLRGSRHRDGPQGAVPAAVALPEIDGARFVLAGLSSWERQATVLVFAWGWPPGRREFRLEQPFSWWARDDAGRWHVGRPKPSSEEAGTFQLELTPPLHPAARSLDIVLTGRSGRVIATVPLTWPGPEPDPRHHARRRTGRR